MTHTQTQGADGAGTSLDDRLRAAGMFTVPEMMGETPLTRWQTHAAMTSLDAFEWWLDAQVRQYLTMKAQYEIGDKPKDDELYEWVLAHSGAFHVIRTNFRAAKAATPAPAATPGVPDSVRALSEAFAETACCASCTTPMDCYQGKPCRLEPVGSGSGVVDHEFKSHPDVFWPAARGEKTFEYRRDDRGGYEVGQTVRLRCYDLTRGYHDTAPLDRRVTNILRGGEFELPMGYCILSLAPLAAQPAGQSTDDGTDRCEVCNKPLIAGQRVMQDVELGTVHTACCGPEREAYVKDVETGEPLGPNDPIPQGYVYEGEEPAGQAGDAGADARTVMTEACKPWEHYTGEPPDDGSPLSGVFVAGMVYTERLLAKLLDVTHYEGGDGSEDFDNDATQTLRNILTGAGLWDADENRAVKPAPNSTRTGAAETEALVRAVEALNGSQLWLDNNHPWRIMLKRGRFNAAVAEAHPESAKGDGEWNDGAVICAIVNEAIKLSAALAARPEAPSDAGWSREDLEAFVAREWPEGRSAGAAARELVRALGARGLAPTLQRLLTDLLGQINFASTDRAQILADFANAAPEAARMAKIDSFERWNPRVFDPTPPSDPAPSGQAEG